MWPFAKKNNVFSLDQYQLTVEERREVSITFDSFTTPEGRKIGKEPHSSAVSRGLTAYALWDYAEQKAIQADGNPNALAREPLLALAIDAIKKAYRIHNLPVYLFDLGRYQEAIGKLIPADRAYRAFIEEQANYEPEEGDYHFLRERNIEKALEDTRESLAYM